MAYFEHRGKIIKTTLRHPPIHTQLAFLFRELNPELSGGAEGISANYQKQTKNSYFQRNHIHMKFKAIYSWNAPITLVPSTVFFSAMQSFNELHIEHLLRWALCQVLRGPQRWMRCIQVFYEWRTQGHTQLRDCQTVPRAYFTGTEPPSLGAHTGMIYPSWGLWGKFPREVRLQMSFEDALVQKEVEHAENVIKAGV